MATRYQTAKRAFKPGVLVEIRLEVLDNLIERGSQPNAGSLSWAFCGVDLNGNSNPSLEFRAVRVIRLRDSDDDPFICVCATSDTGRSACGWFHPDDLTVRR